MRQLIMHVCIMCYVLYGECYLLVRWLVLSEDMTPRAVDMALPRLGACRVAAAFLSNAFFGGVVETREACVLPVGVVAVRCLLPLVTLSLDTVLGIRLVVAVVLDLRVDTAFVRLVEFFREEVIFVCK